MRKYFHTKMHRAKEISTDGIQLHYYNGSQNSERIFPTLLLYNRFSVFLIHTRSQDVAGIEQSV
jgi:hypothetical protein